MAKAVNDEVPFCEEKAKRRFFADAACNPLTLTEGEHHHLTQVLRAKVGERVVVCTGDGYDYTYAIRAVHKTETVLDFVEKEKNDREPTVRVTLFSAVMKGDKNEFVAQKATELGVWEICPMRTAFVQAHDRNLRVERLQKIVREAAKQCGRSTYPTVHEPVDFAKVTERLAAFDCVVFPYERAKSPSLKAFLREKDFSATHSIAVIVGSEGGFSEQEAAALVECGVTPVSLGKRILRAETANIAVLSAIMYEAEQWQ